MSFLLSKSIVVPENQHITIATIDFKFFKKITSNTQLRAHKFLSYLFKIIFNPYNINKKKKIIEKNSKEQKTANILFEKFSM
jgi:hypothetical protein